MQKITLDIKLDTFFNQQRLSTYKKRSMILSAHDDPTNVFYIKSGYIRVYRLSEQGEELTLNILKPKDVFPITYGFSHNTNIYYLEALTSLEILRCSKDVFSEFISNNPDIYHEITNKLVVHLDGLLSRMEYLVLSNAYTKIVSTLIVCAKRFGEVIGKDIVIQVPLTHKDIATLIGITRETTSLEMKRLEKNGYVGKSGKNLIIKNIQALQNTISPTLGKDTIFSYPL